MFRKYVVIVNLVLLILAFFSTPTQAENKPIQLALLTPVQIFAEEHTISGIRLNIFYGRNVSVTGLDLGLINHTTTGESIGVQFGLVGLADTDFVGWQNNFLNVVENNFEGFQWGLVNYAHSANGFQLGLVNYAVKMHGLQIGLINIIKQDGAFPVFPIVNWSF